MSRIHEALKKAAEERSTKLAASPSSDLLDVTSDFGRPRVIEPGPMLPVRPEVRSNAGSLLSQIEELAKRCTHPAWHPDPRTSVFHGGDLQNIGAERFRTLRSRLSQIAATQTLKKIIVTSSIPAEGKTFVASNLANSIVRQPDRR